MAPFPHGRTPIVLFAVMVISTACGRETESAAVPTTKPAAQADEPLPPSDLETRLPAPVRDALFKPFTGDFDEMIQRRLVRVGVAPSRTFYFVDKGVPRGAAHEYLQLMEERINARQADKTAKVNVFVVPMPREKLLSALVDGTIDLAEQERR